MPVQETRNGMNNGNSEPIAPLADTSHFTQSNRKGPNLATYYFKHEDTDSDMDKAKQQKPEEPPKADETSEDEWTFAKPDQQNPPPQERSPSARAATSKTLMQNIRRLVQEAEELVSPDKCKIRQKIMTPVNKISRVKEWLDMEKPIDSCDASGEDDEQESQTSEELNESVATFRAVQEMGSQNTSFGEVDSAESTPKASFQRQRYGFKASRPWSVSCISQLTQGTVTTSIDQEVPSMSISESALHKLSYAQSNFHNGVVPGNSTSSTMEESGAVLPEERTSPARKKRLKFKKKPFRKSESSVTSLNRHTGALMKSGSFSGCSNRICSNERHTSSDPSVINAGFGTYETSTTSGAESDEEKNRRIPAFRIGCKASYLNFSIRDESPGKNSLNTAEEQSSSLSEQAWDSYQEKYLSEAYSEAHDSDAARRLLEFGEDYRNYLDSQSDWSQSTNPEFSPVFGRKTIPVYNNTLDSDDEVENMRQLLQESKNLFQHTRNVYSQSFKLGLREYLVSNDIGEMLCTCDRHVHLLNMIEQSPEEYSLGPADREETSGLLTNWQGLRAHVIKMQAYRDLQREITILRAEFDRITSKASPLSANVFQIGSLDDLAKQVEFCTASLSDLMEFKKKLLPLNVVVHRFLTENGEYANSTLKSGISELYGMWHEYHGCASDQVARLNGLLQTWQVLETRLEQLQGDLREDEQTLGVLDTALQGGKFSNQMAVTVRDVAKLLSERKSSPQSRGLPELFTEGGSLSDSGISDEGSENDLGERERRLAAIRRLVRQMESVMAPDCEARRRMAEKLAAAEEELRALQSRCRSLIVRTAAICTGASSRSMESLAADDAGDDPPPVPDTPWFKRVMRAALPFHVALFALLCLACLLESNCCDNMNNFSMSLSPQLRYVRGPPPL